MLEDVKVVSKENWDGRFHVPDCDQVIWDSIDGAGAVGYQGNIRYMGFGVMMYPSDFLSVAAYLRTEERRGGSLKYLESIALTKGWGPPILYIDWQYPEYARVIGHEGRHRANVFKQLCGASTPILVHIKPEGIRAKNIDREQLSWFRGGVYKEGTRREWIPDKIFLTTDIFDRAFILDHEYNWR